MVKQTQGSRAGRPRTTPHGLVSRTLRFDPRLWAWYRQYALDNEISIQAVVTQLMEEFKQTAPARR